MSRKVFLPQTLCIVCYKIISVTPTSPSDVPNEGSKNEDLSRTLTRFFQLMERYLDVDHCQSGNDEHGGIQPFSTENANKAGLLSSCVDCSKLVESFCELYHQMKSIQLLLNWKVKTLKNIMLAAQRVPSRMKAFQECVEQLDRGDVTPDEIFDFKEELIKKCRRKLKNSFPRLTLQKYGSARDNVRVPQSSSSSATSSSSSSTSPGESESSQPFPTSPPIKRDPLELFSDPAEDNQVDLQDFRQSTNNYEYDYDTDATNHHSALTEVVVIGMETEPSDTRNDDDNTPPRRFVFEDAQPMLRSINSIVYPAPTPARAEGIVGADATAALTLIPETGNADLNKRTDTNRAEELFDLSTHQWSSHQPPNKIQERMEKNLADPDHSDLAQSPSFVAQNMQMQPFLGSTQMCTTGSNNYQSSSGPQRSQVRAPNKNLKCPPPTIISSITGGTFTESEIRKLDKAINPETGKQKCSLCPSEFSSPQCAQDHYESIHLGISYGCTCCGKRFAQRCVYSKHFRMAHGDQPFQCKLCSTRFTHYSNLMLHTKLRCPRRHHDRVDNNIPAAGTNADAPVLPSPSLDVATSSSLQNMKHEVPPIPPPPGHHPAHYPHPAMKHICNFCSAEFVHPSTLLSHKLICYMRPPPPQQSSFPTTPTTAYIVPPSAPQNLPYIGPGYQSALPMSNGYNNGVGAFQAFIQQGSIYLPHNLGAPHAVAPPPAPQSQLPPIDNWQAAKPNDGAYYSAGNVAVIQPQSQPGTSNIPGPGNFPRSPTPTPIVSKVAKAQVSHEKRFACDWPLCRKKLTSSAHLKRHVKSVHLKLKPYSCNACGHAFAQPEQLKVHRRKIHNMP